MEREGQIPVRMEGLRHKQRHKNQVGSHEISAQPKAECGKFAAILQVPKPDSRTRYAHARENTIANTTQYVILLNVESIGTINFWHPHPRAKS